MTTKRKPEDVVLDEEAVGKAEKVFRSFPGNVKGCLSASFRTYIAELDLIPRPQTVEEWRVLLPWDDVAKDVEAMGLYGITNGPMNRSYFDIPRPKPPRMTDEEIRGKAFSVGLSVYHTLIKAGEPEVKAQLEGFRAEDAERAKLEKERGDE